MSYCKTTLNIEQIDLYCQSSIVSGFAIQGTFAMPGDIFDCCKKRWTESRKAVKYPAMHRRVPHRKELSILICQ